MINLNNFTEIFTELFENTEKSKTKFASLVGIDHKLVSLYLNGIIPTTQSVVKICDYFDCSIDYIVGIDKNYSYKNMIKGYNAGKFYPEYERLLKLNSTNHYRLSKQGIVCESSLSKWKLGGLPKFEFIIKIAYELSGSIDKLLGRIK